jgi:hypothetical protein
LAFTEIRVLLPDGYRTILWTRFIQREKQRGCPETIFKNREGDSPVTLPNRPKISRKQENALMKTTAVSESCAE